MKTLILAIVVMVASLALMAGPVSAATSTGPYYATPSWDQQLDPSVRFIVLSNWGGAAVLDRETGLVWEQSPSVTARIWAAAHAVCNNSTVGNRKGWRLPTVQELASLVDPTQSSPALPAGHPFTNVQSSFYWSATGLFSDGTVGYDVNFVAGNVGLAVKGLSDNVWCVRGRQGVDLQ
jgi:uncharacterized protein DUF1566